MDSYRSLHFASSAEDITQRYVGVEGFGVNFQCLSEGIDCLVLAVVEQEIQPAIILRRQLRAGFSYGLRGRFA